VAPKSRIIERPLLVNGYASLNGFIGNSSFPTQRENSYQSYTFLYTIINALNRQRTYNIQPLNEGFSIRSDCNTSESMRTKTVSYQRVRHSKKKQSQLGSDSRIEDSSGQQSSEKTSEVASSRKKIYQRKCYNCRVV
jgi:hypothetical protein